MKLRIGYLLMFLFTVLSFSAVHNCMQYADRNIATVQSSESTPEIDDLSVVIFASVADRLSGTISEGVLTPIAHQQLVGKSFGGCLSFSATTRFFQPSYFLPDADPSFKRDLCERLHGVFALRRIII